jgi:hypothetical protein
VFFKKLFCAELWFRSETNILPLKQSLTFTFVGPDSLVVAPENQRLVSASAIFPTAVIRFCLVIADNVF